MRRCTCSSRGSGDESLEKTFIVPGFSLRDTLYCGQCFRFIPYEDSFAVTVGDRRILVRQDADLITVSSDESADLSWAGDYLGLNDDYRAVNLSFSADPKLAEITGRCGTIRIMRQPFWETLESFIISQNNNIPRIQKIIEKFCELFGKDMGGFHAFPLPEAVAKLDEDDLSELHCGYRAPYLIDAAKKVSDGTIQEELLRTLPLDEARDLLMTVKGVGPKVADCTLLFGLHRLEAFPRDTWIKKAMAELFPEGLPECAAENAGIAQQYIFHYARNMGMLEKNKSK